MSDAPHGNLHLLQDPEFKDLVARKNRFSIILTVITLVIYYGFILLIAFKPGVFSNKVAGNVTFGLALAGDYMSAASFLGIAGLVASKGYDGLIYSVGFLVGWPICMFLIAEPLRNLGKFTFADVVAYRLNPRPIRTAAATGAIITVVIYLTAQMVGAGKLIELLFKDMHLKYIHAVVGVGVLMMVYVLFGGMKA